MKSRAELLAVASILFLLAQAAFADTAVVKSPAGLRIRSGPFLEAEKLGVIPHGTAVTVMEVKEPEITVAGVRGRWTKVRWEKTDGWVFGGFLGKPSASEKGVRLPAGFHRKWVGLIEKNGKMVVPVWCFAETPYIAFRNEKGSPIMEFNMGQESVVFEVTGIAPIKNGYAFDVKEVHISDGYARTILFKRHPSLPGRCTWENLGGAWDDSPFVGGNAIKKYPVWKEMGGKCPRQ